VDQVDGFSLNDVGCERLDSRRAKVLTDVSEISGGNATDVPKHESRYLAAVGTRIARERTQMNSTGILVAAARRTQDERFDAHVGERSDFFVQETIAGQLGLMPSLWHEVEHAKRSVHRSTIASSLDSSPMLCLETFFAALFQTAVVPAATAANE
jgi:hypothetical protein